MSLWDQMTALMDGKVDDYLGDDISYSRGGGAPVAIKGFVVTSTESQTQLDEYDAPVGSRFRIKLARTLPILAGAEPDRRDRITSPKLGTGTWQPMGVEPDQQTQGRYWIFDVQKV